MAYSHGHRFTDADLEAMLADSDELNESAISSDDEIDFESSDSEYVPPEDEDMEDSDDSYLTEDDIHSSDIGSENDSEWEEVNENSDNPPNPNVGFMDIHVPTTRCRTHLIFQFIFYSSIRKYYYN